MRKVLKNHSEVAHVWAQQNQSEGRASRVFFEGPSIYSYGKHFEIARFVTPEIVLFNSANYSISTGKHKNLVYRAVNHKTVFTVPTMEQHDDNAKYLIKEIKDEIERLKRARKGFKWCLPYLNDKINVAHSYLGDFRKKITLKTREEIRSLNKYRIKNLPQQFLDKKIAKEKENEKQAETKRKERRRLLELQEKENLDKWLTGEYNGSLWPTSTVYLRIKDDEIQTTRGANIPLIEARKFWHTLERKENVVGMRLGHYTVDSLDGTTLTVGCHNIPLKEVYRMAKNLNWLSEVK